MQEKSDNGFSRPVFGGRWVDQQLGGSPLLANAKAREDDAQQVVGREFAGDLAQRLLGQAQFFGQQVDGGRAGVQPVVRGLQALLRAAQGGQVAFAGDDGAFARRGLPAGRAQQALAQGVQPLADAQSFMPF